jgi:hypothetical protein
MWGTPVAAVHRFDPSAMGDQAMKRRFLLFPLVLGAVAALAALAPVQEQNLLLLQWAAKAGPEAPVVAVLLEMGLKDEQAKSWSGRMAVAGATVVHREGYRFRAQDKLIDPDSWEASSHRPLRQPPKAKAAVAKAEPFAGVGIVLHLKDVRPDAALTVELKDGSRTKVAVPLQPVLSGQPQPLWGGAGAVRRVSTAAPLVTARTEDDFPAAAYGPDGTLWVAYISYTLKEESRRIEQGQLKEQPANFQALYTPDFGDQLFVKSRRGGRWSEPVAVTGPQEDLVRCAIAVEGNGDVWVAIVPTGAATTTCSSARSVRSLAPRPLPVRSRGSGRSRS